MTVVGIQILRPFYTVTYIISLISLSCSTSRADYRLLAMVRWHVRLSKTVNAKYTGIIIIIIIGNRYDKISDGNYLNNTQQMYQLMEV